MVKIASIYPRPLHATRAIYAGTFNIPAVPLNAKPAILEIKDHYQFEPQPIFMGTGPNGKPLMKRDIITAMEIATDILREWTKDPLGCNEGCRPGVWLVRELVYLYQADGRPELDADNKPAYREATEAEKKAMWDEDLAASVAAQAAYGEYCVMHGNIMAEDPKKIPFIPDLYRDMAKYYGQSPKWLNRISDANTKGCQWCRQIIAADAVVCPNCSKIVDAVKYAQMEKEQAETTARVAKGIPTPPVKAA
jgi:hypothetical protein